MKPFVKSELILITKVIISRQRSIKYLRLIGLLHWRAKIKIASNEDRIYTKPKFRPIASCKYWFTNGVEIEMAKATPNNAQTSCIK